MTELDLICVPSYQIGLLGSISFVCFSIGSILFTKQADVYGRKKVTLLAGLITPICLIILTIFAKSFGFYFVYLIVSLMALAYNP
jgi:MFS family permease